MKHVVAFFLMLFVGQTLFGQTTSRISVLEKNSRQPVAGAIISFNGGSPVSTDASGTATIKSGKKGNLQLQISAAGYKTISADIFINEISNNFSFELEKTNYLLEPVDITAQRESFRSPF